MAATGTSSSDVLIDTTTDFGRMVADRLAREQVIWLTTVGPSGTPQPNPVWFQWHDGEFLLFSQPDRPKLRNIARNPRVSLHLNSTEHGGEVVIFTGVARVADEPTPAELDSFAEKYADGLVSISMTREEFFAEYSTPVRITPERLRGF